MATTFDVIPAQQSDITFTEVLKLSQNRINQFLQKLGTPQSAQLKAEIISGTERRDIHPDEPFAWPYGKTYAWFSIPGVKGGIDAYCGALHSSGVSNVNKWYFLDELREAPNFQPEYETMLAQAKEVDRKWSFRRSMGQPAIVNLSYGIIAATLAELTKGLIYSGDGAWDYQTLPMTGRDFLQSYFQPECSVKHEMQEWAAQNRMSLVAGVYK